MIEYVEMEVRSSPGDVAPGQQTKAIRNWARGNGHDLSDRGRIPTHIIEEFEKAHRG